MKVVVGLGNPGLEYYFTRHNAGFRVLDQLGTNSGAHFSHKRALLSDMARLRLASQDLLLVKPTTYMNCSGQAVLAIIQWYKIAVEELLVVHDDVSLPLGKLRFQKGGGAGGQHGIESIIERLSGARNFQRLKIGVGPDPGGAIRANYLLSPIPQQDRDLYERCLTMAVEAVQFYLANGLLDAMNKYNGCDLRAPLAGDDTAEGEKALSDSSAT